jgi:hypothetical protein
LAVAVAVTGATLHQRNERAQMADDVGNLLDGRRDPFVKHARQFCIRQRISLIDRARGITDQQVVNYCQCFATAMAELITFEEIIEWIKNGNKLTETARQKADAIEPTCIPLLTRR